MITAIPAASIHAITSNQVVISLETAVKELVENSLDAGATSLEIRFKQYGVKSVEVVDNGSGIGEKDWESIGLKHHTSKIAAFSDLSTVNTFGFRGEALSSLCAMCDEVTVTTRATEAVGVVLELDNTGKVKGKKRVARQRGTTVSLINPFAPLPVRRKDFERNAKREYGKALTLLQAYALVPCSKGPGVRLLVTNTNDKGSKSTSIQTQGKPSLRASATALWGPKSLDGVQDLSLEFSIPRPKIKKPGQRSMREEALLGEDVEEENPDINVKVQGLISSPGHGRGGTDKQFLYVNGRPCSLSKVQKAINDVFRTFTPNHDVSKAPLFVADIELPTDCYDVNVTPDKRTLLLHNEAVLLGVLKTSLEEYFEPSRSTYGVYGSQRPSMQSTLKLAPSNSSNEDERELDEDGETISVKRKAFLRKPQDEEQESTSQKEGSMSTNMPLPPSFGTSGKPSRVSTSSDAPLPSTEHPVHSSSPSLGPSSTVSATNVPLPSSSALDDDGMDVDTHTELSSHSEPSSTSASSSISQRPSHRLVSPGSTRNSKEKDVVVNTLFASWARTAVAPAVAKRSAPEPSVDDEDIEEEEEETADMQPQKKKPKIVAPQPKKLSTGKQATLDFRSKMAGFARTGSKVKELDIEDDEEQEDESDVLQISGDVAEKQDTTSRGSKAHEGGGYAPTFPIAEVDDMDVDIPLPIALTSEDILESSDRGSQVDKPEVIRTSSHGDVALRIDLKGIAKRWAQPSTKDVFDSPAKRIPDEAGISGSGDAGSALSRIISKVDFGEMDIIGQFNLGFIITRRRKKEERMDDLFIVDQHAADEKYNFETLQETTKIRSQRLFRPKPLELAATDEMVALENIEVLRQNGFEIEVTENEDDEVEEIGVGCRLRLVAQPVSKSTEFDMKDLEELINLMQDRPAGQMVRCSKARAMFAMRACRKSVMVGMPLKSSQMSAVVRHMGKMDQPWNCPHGRPTMRHLCDLTAIPLNKGGRDIDWKAF